MILDKITVRIAPGNYFYDFTPEQAAVRQANFNSITDPVTVPDHDRLPYPYELIKTKNNFIK
jgi:hypothetical protein